MNAKILNIVMHDMQFIKFKSLKIALYGDKTKLYLYFYLIIFL